MKNFNGKALFLDRTNINTDEIIPARYLTEVSKEALQPYLFEDLRLDGFNPQKDISGKNVIVSRANFGCGSSREHAPWALEANGIHLVIAESHTKVDLKALTKRLGAGRFSFGKPDLLMEVLGVTPGSVTAFAAMNDRAGQVSVVVDDRLMHHDTVNCHPLENAATTNIARADLFRFLSACGHAPHVCNLGAADSS